MKRISCDLFGRGQTIYFNVLRLKELEVALGKPILNVFTNGFGVTELLAAFVIGLQHEKKRTEQWYATEIQKLLDEGACEYEELVKPVMLALIGSGLLGKEAYYAAFPEELSEEEALEMEADRKNE